MAHTLRILNHPEVPEPISALERSLHRRASKEGISIEALREADLNWLRSPSYPTPECFDPYEVEKFFSTALSPERAEHVETCPMCAALVEASVPSSGKFEEFSKFLSSAPEEQGALETTRQPTWKPMKDLCKVQLPIVVALGAFVLWVFWRHDAIMATLLAENARRSILVVGLAGVVSIVLAAVGSKWLSDLFPPFERVGGLALGLVFACVIGVYFFKMNSDMTRSHERMLVAQKMLFDTIISEQKSGHVYSDTLYQRKVAAGTLVAARNGDAFEIYWERLGKRRELGTVYEGRVQRESGIVMIRADNPGLDIPSMPLPKELPWKVGESVTALVQKNGTVPVMVSSSP
jgi:hypothetical protein